MAVRERWPGCKRLSQGFKNRPLGHTVALRRPPRIGPDPSSTALPAHAHLPLTVRSCTQGYKINLHGGQPDPNQCCWLWLVDQDGNPDTMFEQDVAKKAVLVGNETKNGVPTEHWAFKGRFPFPQDNDWWFTPNGRRFLTCLVLMLGMPPHPRNLPTLHRPHTCRRHMSSLPFDYVECWLVLLLNRCCAILFFKKKFRQSGANQRVCLHLQAGHGGRQCLVSQRR